MTRGPSVKMGGVLEFAEAFLPLNSLDSMRCKNAKEKLGRIRC